MHKTQSNKLKCILTASLQSSFVVYQHFPCLFLLVASLVPVVPLVSVASLVLGPEVPVAASVFLFLVSSEYQI